MRLWLSVCMYLCLHVCVNPCLDRKCGHIIGVYVTEILHRVMLNLVSYFGRRNNHTEDDCMYVCVCILSTCVSAVELRPIKGSGFTFPCPLPTKISSRLPRVPTRHFIYIISFIHSKDTDWKRDSGRREENEFLWYIILQHIFVLTHRHRIQVCISHSYMSFILRKSINNTLTEEKSSYFG